MSSLDTLIDGVAALPPAPRVLPELLALLGQDDIDAEKVVEKILYDPALTVNVLRRCNSAHFAGSDPVGDVHSAVMRLGFKPVFQIVASTATESTLSAPQKGYGLAHGELWRHAAVCAIAGQRIARTCGDDENLYFTAALLHDLGKLVLSTAMETSYATIAHMADHDGRSLLEAEKAVLGFDHAEVGGRLLERWKFHSNLVSAVRWHHRPSEATEHAKLAAGVHLADIVAHFLGHGYGHHAYAVRAQEGALDLLRLSGADVEALVLSTQSDTAACALFHVQPSSP